MADFNFTEFPIPAKVTDDPDDKANKSTTVNGHPLSADVEVVAGDIDYSGTASGLSSSDVQGAIDELASEKAEKTTTVNGKPLSANVEIGASDVAIENTASGLTAQNVQTAVDELADEKADKTITVNNQPISDNVQINASDVPYDNQETGLSATDVQGAIDAIHSGLSEGWVPASRTVNGEQLNDNITLTAANFEESVTGEKMLASLTFTVVSSW